MTAAAAFLYPQETLDFSVVYEIVPHRLEESGLPSVIREIVSLFDGSRSAKEVVSHAQISATKTRAVVKKLTRLGIIRPVPGVNQKSPTEAFSAQEEAFFSTKLGPIDECDLPFESLSDKLRRAAKQAAQRMTRR